MASFQKSSSNSWFKKIAIFLSVLGPGIIAANADNDAAGIATYTISGARYGYGLLFSLFIITFVLAVTQEMGTRIGVVTGKGLGGVIRERFGLKLTMLAMFFMAIANAGVIIADMAGIAESMELFGISKYIAVPIIVFILWLLLYKGSFKRAEKIFLALSGIYIVYIVTAFYTKPDWGEALTALVKPHLQFDRQYLLTLIALIGTTVTPWGQFFIQSYVVDKGIRLKHYAYERLEIFIGAFITDFFSFFVIVTAANTLFKNNIFVDTASQAALSLTPLAGHYASILFAVGFLNAGIMGASIVTLATAYAICEAFGFESGLDRNRKEAPIFYGIIITLLIGSGLIVLIPGLPLFRIMLLSQGLNGMLLPIILIYAYKIINDKKVMGEYKNSRIANIITLTALGLLVFASILVLISSF
ncbi:Mn transporter [candidate division CPR3 bacterium GWF2_35_18]|uniref:Natural resistance-associated macrophage protein n=1 Tax=candidate division CPR3 bacterium GW2011_GWF2_35_18 TaxID=1618350 RepID=A0A0G0BJU4_UNCC3|nr:MAG: Natural resistance-associated macrophage protein [candidate division CPR3 bacterium GW2011_GWF2_35_18]KKP86688.1 MAG: Natural resistance-associated macrophage protein [candidate division CPR3 bacterium GW2011_GWE2_35_7]OGB63649.1 MAG: Mn transporter [candidate division CPR3 bacterium GWF2_35_18]OGB65031.1 MAG: Mn transporter [candidate division CPR3 bacterium RIFOXYA2_FULL_35_13]OGB78604.1 MAG: Mn transporter [candidate division CPR3 bacterium RIFOXYB2_FULL_35_8]OGB80449.1 MAG: Mn tran